MLTKNQKNFIQSFSMFCIVIITAILTSCTFTEKIIIEEDGSGSYNMDMDMSKFMSFASSLGEESDSVETEKVIKEVVDSVFYFSEYLEENKDSISKLPVEERIVLESLKDAKMKMHIDDENGEMIMNFIYGFNDVNDLQEIQKKVAKGYSLSNKKEKSTSNTSKTPNSTTYTYSDKSFKRSVTATNMTKKDRKEYDKGMDEMAMFFSGSTYNIEYHFPNRIKKTTAKNATFSKDKKVLYISYPFDELLKDETVLDFEVKF